MAHVFKIIYNCLNIIYLGEKKGSNLLKCFYSNSFFNTMAKDLFIPRILCQHTLNREKQNENQTFNSSTSGLNGLNRASTSFSSTSSMLAGFHFGFCKRVFSEQISFD